MTVTADRLNYTAFTSTESLLSFLVLFGRRAKIISLCFEVE